MLVELVCDHEGDGEVDRGSHGGLVGFSMRSSQDTRLNLSNEAVTRGWEAPRSFLSLSLEAVEVVVSRPQPNWENADGEGLISK